MIPKNLNIQQPQILKVGITKEESLQAKALAKSLGFSYQGWLGQLVKRELSEMIKKEAFHE